MKVTKNILREIIEAEMNLLNEAVTEASLRDAFETFGALVGVGPNGVVVSDIDVQPAAMTNARNAFRSFHETVVADDWQGPRKGMLSRIYQVAQEKNLASEDMIEEAGVPDEVVTSWSGSSTTGQDFLADIDDDFDIDWGNETLVDDSAGEAVVAQDAPFADGDIELLSQVFAGNEVLKSGSRGDKVSALQRVLIVRLRQNGLDSFADAMGEPDGNFGPKTKSAVKALQGKYNISDDGVIGRQTMDSIIQNAASSLAQSNVRSASAGGDEATAQGPTTPDRPAELGSGFEWDPELEIWWSDMDHSYDGVSYNLWIRKGDDEWHANGSHDALDISDFVSPTNESKSLSARLGMIISEAINLVPHIDGTSENDTAASEMVGSSPAEAEEEGATQEMSDDLVALKVGLRKFNEIAKLSTSELDSALRIIDGMTMEDFNPLRRNAYRRLNLAYKRKVADLLKSVSGFPESKIESFSDNVHKFVDIKNGDEGASKISITKILNHGGMVVAADSDKYNNINGKIGFFYAERGRLAPRGNVELFDKTIEVVGVSQFIIIRDTLRKIRAYIDDKLPAVATESLSYDRLQKLAGILKG